MKTKLLLLLLLANFSIYAQTNLVPNGDFETWTSSSQPDNWYRYFSGLIYQNSSAQKGNSSTKMEITSGTFNYMNSSPFAIQSGKTYRITLYQKLVSGTFSSIELSITKSDAFKTTIKKLADATSLTSEWRKIEFDYVSTTSQNAEISVWITGTASSQVLIDNISVVDVAELTPQYTLIPDLNFEKKLIALGYDSGEDGKVLTSKIASLTFLDVSNSSITDMTGIQDFINLKSLSCTNNNIKTLDLSKNLPLETLNCSSNKITILNVTKNTKLLNLYCYDNSLATINLLTNPVLKSLICYKNQITTLNLLNNTALVSVNCSYNDLSTIDLSNHADLYELNCFSNSITSINVSKSILLNSLDCSLNNGISLLDLSNNTAITQLDCSVNTLTSLDLSKNILLKKVNCASNKLTNLILPNLATLTFLQCDQNKLTNLDVTTKINLETLICSFNELTVLNVSQNTLLTKLTCHYNKIKSLNISQNSALTTFYCHSNQLTELNLKNGKNTLLTNANVYLDSNPNLKCIQVDDVNYATTTWLKKDATASYSATCNLGIEDSVFDKVTVYPNPTKGDVYINNILLEKATVYNSLGQLVKSFIFKSGDTNNTINLSGLPKGIYYVYLINEDAASAKKVIVE